MSNEEEKIETPTTEEAVESQPKSWQWLKGLLSVILLVGFIGLCVLFYMQWNNAEQQSRQITVTQNQLKQLRNEVDQATQATASVAQTIQELNNKVSQLQTAQALQTDQEQWVLAEAKYLVKLANDKVQFENNVTAAITLLKMADQQLRHSPNPKLEDIRKALALDIANLQSVPAIDTTGIYLKLSALNGKIDQLPLINKPTTAPVQNINETPMQKNPSWWQRGLHASWQNLQQVVVVRYNKTGKLPLIPPDQQEFFYQNLHSVFLQGMWALLHGQNDIFHVNLQLANAWISEYAVADAALTRAMLDELSQLEKIDIHPAVPKITTLEVFAG